MDSFQRLPQGGSHNESNPPFVRTPSTSLSRLKLVARFLLIAKHQVFHATHSPFTILHFFKVLSLTWMQSHWRVENLSLESWQRALPTLYWYELNSGDRSRSTTEGMLLSPSRTFCLVGCGPQWTPPRSCLSYHFGRGTPPYPFAVSLILHCPDEFSYCYATHLAVIF